jgi:16S rRNA U1498 N3-methylase RsmE
MEHPFFYESALPVGKEPFQLGEDSSRHIVTVLRMRNGERLLLTDGQGSLVEVEILDADKKKTQVRRVASGQPHPQAAAEQARPLPQGNSAEAGGRGSALILAVSLL